jgi:polygalacturonase
MRFQLADTAWKATLVVCGCSLAALPAGAQDTRNVTEPVTPPVCIILHAALNASLIAPHGIAPKDELWVDTQRIQMSINHCGRGQAVELSSNGVHNAFLSGALRLRKGVTLLVDKDVTLYGSRNPRDYDVHHGSCGQVSESRRKGCRALIEADRAGNSGVMGEGRIDGRGGDELLVHGAAQDVSWWTLAEEAHLWGHPQVPRLIDADRTNNFTVSGVTLKDAAGVHVGFRKGNGLTVWGVKIDAPRTARDADGVVPSAAKNITVADSYIRTGSAAMDILTGSGSIRNVSVLRNRFYWGQGMAIGSENGGDVRSVRVSDLSLDGADKGIHIGSNTSRGGKVQDVTYEDVCIRRSKSPILIDTRYGNQGQIPDRSPVYEDIVLRNVRVSGGGQLQLRGVDKAHHIGIQFDGVTLTDPDAAYTLSSSHADILQGPGPVNFLLLGEDSTISGRLGGKAKLASCAAKFVAFPTGTAQLAKAGRAPEMPVREISAQKTEAVNDASVQSPIPSAAKTVVRESDASVLAKPAAVSTTRQMIPARLATVSCSPGRCHSFVKHRVVGRVRVRHHCRACRSSRRTLRAGHRRVVPRRGPRAVRQAVSD